MEIATIMVSLLLILFLGSTCWMMWQLRRAVKGITDDLHDISRNLTVLSDQLTIIVYLAAKNDPRLLEQAPDLAQKALEAAERLGRKELSEPNYQEKKEETGSCSNCGQDLKKFPARNANQRCPTRQEIRRGHYD